jgi:hypothetical protein
MSAIIVVTEDNLFTNEPIAVTEMADIMCAALTGAVGQVKTKVSEQIEDPAEVEKITKELFDCLNLSFSKCLENSFPEYELHPELTEEVLQKEDELLAQKVAEVESEKLQ